MIRELDFSKITLRIMEHDDNDGEEDGDHVIAKLTGNTIDTLRKALVRRWMVFRAETFSNHFLEHPHPIHTERQTRA